MTETETDTDTIAGEPADTKVRDQQTALKHLKAGHILASSDSIDERLWLYHGKIGGHIYKATITSGGERRNERCELPSDLLLKEQGWYVIPDSGVMERNCSAPFALAGVLKGFRVRRAAWPKDQFIALGTNVVFADDFEYVSAGLVRKWGWDCVNCNLEIGGGDLLAKDWEVLI